MSTTQNNARQYSYRKVGEKKGQKRIWLEGLTLAECGFKKGCQYRTVIDADTGTISITADTAGDRLVSGRKQQNNTIKPIIELCSNEITKAFNGISRVRVIVKPGHIHVSVHHHILRRRDRERLLLENLSRNEVTEGTLCAGGGISTHALHQGFKDAGVKMVCQWFMDRDQRYLQVAIDNNEAIQDATIFEASLEEIEMELVDDVNIMQVSLPCTGHSISGKSKNKIKCAEQHAKDALAVVGFFKILEASNPSIIISENVTQAQNSASYDLIRKHLDVLGYSTFEMTLDHDQAGTIEARKRYWLVAVSNGLKDVFEWSEIPNVYRNYKTLGDAMDQVDQNDPMWSKNEYLTKKAIRDEVNGKGFKRQFVNEDSRQIGVIGKDYNKRRSTEPFILRDDMQERLLTKDEHARVKGIPERLVANTSNTVAHQVLGQSILYGHAYGIAWHIAERLQNIANQKKMESEYCQDYEQQSNTMRMG